MRVGSSIMAIFASFARYILRTFTSKATVYIILYYVASLVALQLSSLTPKYMTLNYFEWPFCVEICFGLGI